MHKKKQALAHIVHGVFLLPGLVMVGCVLLIAFAIAAILMLLMLRANQPDRRPD